MCVRDYFMISGIMVTTMMNIQNHSSLELTCHKRTLFPIHGLDICRTKRPPFISLSTTYTGPITSRHLNLKETNSMINNNYLDNPQEKHQQKSISDEPYFNLYITNEKDFKIRDLLDATETLSKQNPEFGLTQYQKIYDKYNSDRALFGIGKSSNDLAMKYLKNLELMNENGNVRNELQKKIQDFQNKSLNAMCEILNTERAPTFLYLQAGQFCLELASKMNLEDRTIQALTTLHNKYPKKSKYGFQLGFKLLLHLEIDRAEKILRGILNKKNESKMMFNVKYLLGLCLRLKSYNKRVVAENNEEVNGLVEMALKDEEDSLKMFNLIGTTYNRNRKYGEAEVIFDEGVRIGLFLSKWQRSSSKKDFRLKGLRGLPIWQPKQTGYHKSLSKLQENYHVIRQEALTAFFGKESAFKEEAENLREEGLWQQLVLFETGVQNANGCKLAPKTCDLILKYMKEIAAECKHGQVKFSVIHSGTHVWPHSGPSNCRLRAHLGLVIPDVTDDERLEIRIADGYASWKEGQFLIIDDSFEHEVWYRKKNGGIRLILLIDMWHPDLSKDQREAISPLINRNQNHSTIFTVSGIVDQISDQDLIK